MADRPDEATVEHQADSQECGTIFAGDHLHFAEFAKPVNPGGESVHARLSTITENRVDDQTVFEVETLIGLHGWPVGPQTHLADTGTLGRRWRFAQAIGMGGPLARPWLI